MPMFTEVTPDNIAGLSSRVKLIETEESFDIENEYFVKVTRGRGTVSFQITLSEFKKAGAMLKQANKKVDAKNNKNQDERLDQILKKKS